MKVYPVHFTLEVIELYKHLTCLWKKESPEYSDPEDRRQAYQILVEKFRTAKRNATKNCVRSKLKSLRKGFKNSYFKYKVWQRDHPDTTKFKTTFPYFQQLLFLTPYYEDEWQQMVGINKNRRESRSRRQEKNENEQEDADEDEDKDDENDEDDEDDEDYEDDEDDEDDKLDKVDKDDKENKDDADNDNRSNEEFVKDNLHDETQENDDFMEVESSTDMTDIKILAVKTAKIESSEPTARDGPKTTANGISTEQDQAMVDENPPFRICCAGSINQSDEYDKFGSFIAANLRKINHRQSMFAQKLISNVLLNASLESLDRSSAIVKKNTVISK